MCISEPELGARYSKKRFSKRACSRVRVGLVTFHGKRYSGSVLLPLMVKPPNLLLESWQIDGQGFEF
jgi:hypothetical protein